MAEITIDKENASSTTYYPGTYTDSERNTCNFTLEVNYDTNTGSETGFVTWISAIPLHNNWEEEIINFYKNI
jgi:hypothetical protein